MLPGNRDILRYKGILILLFVPTDWGFRLEFRWAFTAYIQTRLVYILAQTTFRNALSCCPPQSQSQPITLPRHRADRRYRSATLLRYVIIQCVLDEVDAIQTDSKLPVNRPTVSAAMPIPQAVLTDAHFDSGQNLVRYQHPYTVRSD